MHVVGRMVTSSLTREAEYGREVLLQPSLGRWVARIARAEFPADGNVSLSDAPVMDDAISNNLRTDARRTHNGVCAVGLMNVRECALEITLAHSL